MNSAYLLAYFRSELQPDGEQIRFAVSSGPTPDGWTELRGGAPMLRSDVGEGGVRDPFLVRTAGRGGPAFVLLATDLRAYPGEDWGRAVRRGSRRLAVWTSEDLVHWQGPALPLVAPPEAGNTWAPKAYWSERERAWLVFVASALYPDGIDRAPGSYQRILVSRTQDFRDFSEAEVFLDLGHDVIDLAFLEEAGEWYRFSANAHTAEETPELGHHIFQEHGSALEDPDYEPRAIDIGKPDLVHGEGPALAPALDRDGWYLLIDEFGLRGYQVFHAPSAAPGRWTRMPDLQLPVGARHGSLLPITVEERARLLDGDR